MVINQLRYFLAVCKCGSMAEAAKSLHITQQGISIALRRLEAEMGRSLFYHKSRGVVLTQFGMVFRDEAEIIITHVNKLYELCKTYEGDGKVEITVAITRHQLPKQPVSLQQLLLVPPSEYKVGIVNEYSNICADMVYEGGALFGLVYGDYSAEKFDMTPLEEAGAQPDTAEYVFVVNRDSRFAARDTITIKELDGVASAGAGYAHEAEHSDSGAVPPSTMRGLNVAYEYSWPRQAIDIVANNPSLVARTMLSDVTETDRERVKPLRLDGEALRHALQPYSQEGQEADGARAAVQAPDTGLLQIKIRLTARK